ncbi:hypothetical protein [Gordonia paraffinivorans]|uniref:hypothetical protein n=1 Tax=Gordonia paraffinivorans TaxID=175628 RepID=UPI003FCCB144
MPTVVWIVIAVVAVALVVGGLVRMRDWLKKPVPPEVIEAAQRRRELEREEGE